MTGCDITDEYERRGIDVVFMENDDLFVEILAGKGGDITDIRDKRTDVDILFETPHEWRPPDSTHLGTSDGDFTFLDSYPGGWQTCLPNAGAPSRVHETSFGLHGESAVVPWESTIVDDRPGAVEVSLTTELSRYPFQLERRVSLEGGEPVVHVTETMTNIGEIDIEYAWLQHLVLGEPLVGPEANLSVPCSTGRTIAEPPSNARLPGDVTFDWPICETEEGSIDFSGFPSHEERVLDDIVLRGLEDGTYTISNPAIDLAVTVSFDAELFECLWYWGAFGGFESAPYFGRNYNLGLEPCTTRVTSGLSDAIDEEDANYLDAGESVETTLQLRTSPAVGPPA